MPDHGQRAYRFFGRLVVVDSDSADVADALDAVYARQRAPLPSGAVEPDFRIRVRSGDDDGGPMAGDGGRTAGRDGGTAADGGGVVTGGGRESRGRDRSGGGGPRIEVGERTVRVPDAAQLVHYAHLVLVNAAAALVTDALVLHSGAVARDGRAVLLVGHSGAGKTTLTLEMVRRGWGFLSDDFAVLGSDGMVRPFPRRVNLTDESLDLLGLPPPADGLRLAGFGGREKWMIDIEELFPGCLAGPAPVGALFLLGPGSASGDVRIAEGGVVDAPAVESGPAVWRLQVDHSPEGLEEALAELPGVRSVTRRDGERPPVLEVRMASGARIVAGLDDVCSRLDVSVLAARRTAAGSAGGDDASASARKFEGTPAAARLTRTEALPEVLAHALSLSGRRFLGGTSEREVLEALTVLHGALAAEPAVFRLGSGPLRDTADVVEEASARLARGV